MKQELRSNWLRRLERTWKLITDDLLEPDGNGGFRCVICGGTGQDKRSVRHGCVTGEWWGQGCLGKLARRIQEERL